MPFFILILTLMGCTAPVTKNMNPTLQEGQSINPLASNQGEEAENEEAENPTPQLQKETITLTAVGDILMHNTLIWSGEKPDGSLRKKKFGRTVLRPEIL